MDLKLEKVAGHPYSKVLSGPHQGEYVNQTHNKRNGEFFKLVEKAGRMQHVYGTGKDREVLTMPAKGAAAPGAATEVSGDAAAKSPAAAKSSATTPAATEKATTAAAAAVKASAAADTAARVLSATRSLTSSADA